MNPAAEAIAERQTGGARSVVRGWLSSLALAAGSLLIGVLVVEAVARQAFPPPRYFQLWQWDPALGHAPIPSFSTDLDWYVKQGAPVIRYTTNTMGYRDRERSLDKPPGTLRVLVLGDSFTEAIEVRVRERFTSLLEARLSSSARPLEVWNLGTGDYGTAQEMLVLERWGRRLQPDLVVLVMFPLNDIVNNSHEFALDNESEADHLRPYFALDASGELVPATPRPLRFWLRAHSRFYAQAEFLLWSQQAAAALTRGQRRVERVRGAHRARGEFEILEYRILLAAEPEGRWLRAWRVTEALLDRIARRTRELGSKLLVVSIPSALEFDDATLARRAAAIEAATHWHYGWDGGAATRRLESIAHRRALRFLPLREAFREEIGRYSWQHMRGGHFDPAGHRVIAGWLAPEIECLLAGR